MLFSREHARRAIAAYGMASIVGAQAPSTSGPAPESRFALLSAIDRDGAPVLDLSPDEIIVEEGGQARDILSVTPAAYPVAVVVDTSSFARSGFQELRLAVRKLVDSFSGREVALYTGAEPAECAADFTRDLARIDAALDRTFAQPNGLTDTVTAIVAAAKSLRERKASVTRMVIISAGGPERSSAAPRDVLRDVLASRAIVDVVDMRQIRSGQRVTTIRGSTLQSGPRSTLGDEELLRGLAERTRGRYERIFASGGFTTALELIRRDIVSEVIVEYAAPPDAPRDVRLGLRLPGVVVRGIGLERP